MLSCICYLNLVSRADSMYRIGSAAQMNWLSGADSVRFDVGDFECDAKRCVSVQIGCADAPGPNLFCFCCCSRFCCVTDVLIGVGGGGRGMHCFTILPDRQDNYN
eukprot:1158361-Pelagomonas_calceolata.AAC.2